MKVGCVAAAPSRLGGWWSNNGIVRPRSVARNGSRLGNRRQQHSDCEARRELASGPPIDAREMQAELLSLTRRGSRHWSTLAQYWRGRPHLTLHLQIGPSAPLATQPPY